MTSPDLAVRNLTKRFGAAGSDVVAVSEVSFDVAPGEFFTLLGPSGCGKTTTLRMIAGLETASSGEIRFRGQDYTQIPARQRNIGMVFQSYALFPHMTVFDNVAYGLRQRKTAEAEIRERVGRILELLKLGPLVHRLPSNLSGGQQQRVSIARALVYEPAMLLLDEPLANLDAKLRVHMREEIRRLQRRLGIMVLYVTHDQEEAMAISDRIAVFNQGRLIQVDHPSRVYADPRSLFVADFIGRANFVPIAQARENAAVLPGGAQVPVTRKASITPDDAHLLPQGATTVLMVRPEHVSLRMTGGLLPGRIQRVQFLGSVIRYTVETEGAGEIHADLPRPLEGGDEGKSVGIDFLPADAILYSLNAS